MKRKGLGAGGKGLGAGSTCAGRLPASRKKLPSSAEEGVRGWWERNQARRPTTPYPLLSQGGELSVAFSCKVVCARDGKSYDQHANGRGRTNSEFSIHHSQFTIQNCPWLPGSGVTWSIIACETPVIPAKAGIQSVDSAFLRVCAVDSRFRGNDCGPERPCFANDTTTGCP